MNNSKEQEILIGMHQLRQWIYRIIPKGMILPLLGSFLWNTIAYNLPRMFNGGRYHYDLSTELDRQIHLVPWTVLIYFGCYLFWAVNYIIAVRHDKKRAYRFLLADFIAKMISMMFFFLMPTTLPRPHLYGNGFFLAIMRFLYMMDPADNLFPSLHCLVSWMCFIAVRGRKDVGRGYKWFSMLMAMAVFICTLTTRQHVLADVAGGVLIAELSYLIAAEERLSTIYRKIWRG